MAIKEYLQKKIRSVADSLASIGHPISTDYHFEAIFKVYHQNLNTFNTYVKVIFILVSDMESLLLAQENRLEKHNPSMDSTIVNLAT